MYANCIVMIFISPKVSSFNKNLLIKAVVYKQHMTCFGMYNSCMFVLVCCPLPLEVFKVNNVKNMTHKILQPRTSSIYLLIIGVITEYLVSLYLYLTLMLMKTQGDQVFYKCTFVIHPLCIYNMA